MTRIGGIQGGVGPARRAARGAGGFALPAGSETTEAAGMAPTSSVSALLALQERPAAPGHAAEQARRRGEAALDELRGLQLDLLRGQDDPARLERLARLAEPAAGIEDPALRAALAGIALRARVELARRHLATASTA
jgi:hypothetical protein